MPSATTATCSAWWVPGAEPLRRAARATVPEVRAGAGPRQVRLRGQTPGEAAPRLRHRERAPASVVSVVGSATADPVIGAREVQIRTRSARAAPARAAPGMLRRETAMLPLEASARLLAEL